MTYYQVCLYIKKFLCKIKSKQQIAKRLALFKCVVYERQSVWNSNFRRFKLEIVLFSQIHLIVTIKFRIVILIVQNGLVFCLMIFFLIVCLKIDYFFKQTTFNFLRQRIENANEWSRYILQFLSSLVLFGFFDIF